MTEHEKAPQSASGGSEHIHKQNASIVLAHHLVSCISNTTICFLKEILEAVRRQLLRYMEINH